LFSQLHILSASSNKRPSGHEWFTIVSYCVPENLHK
jgi:hypothetical protein